MAALWVLHTLGLAGDLVAGRVSERTAAHWPMQSKSCHFLEGNYENTENIKMRKNVLNIPFSVNLWPSNLHIFLGLLSGGE